MTYELCPHCGETVSVEPNEDLIAKCPCCGRWILICSMCSCDLDCSGCKYEKRLKGGYFTAEIKEGEKP